MKIILTGVTRIVILIGDYAIKIPKPQKWSHFLRGIIGNIDEWQTWVYNGQNPERKEIRDSLLCPVIWHSWGGWIVIMKRARTLTIEEWDEIDEDILSHRIYFGGDDTISNYGFIESRLVKIDYASLDSHWGEDFKQHKTA